MTDEQTGIERIVLLERLADRGNAIAFQSYFRRLSRCARVAEVVVDAQQYLVVGAGKRAQTAEHIRLENMVAHHEGKRPACDTAARRQH